MKMSLKMAIKFNENICVKNVLCTHAMVTLQPHCRLKSKSRQSSTCNKTLKIIAVSFDQIRAPFKKGSSTKKAFSNRKFAALLSVNKNVRVPHLLSCVSERAHRVFTELQALKRKMVLLSHHRQQDHPFLSVL